MDRAQRAALSEATDALARAIPGRNEIVERLVRVVKAILANERTIEDAAPGANAGRKANTVANVPPPEGAANGTLAAGEAGTTAAAKPDRRAYMRELMRKKRAAAKAVRVGRGVKA